MINAAVFQNHRTTLCCPVSHEGLNTLQEISAIVTRNGREKKTDYQIIISLPYHACSYEPLFCR